MAALTEDLRQKILAYIPRYPSKQAVTLPALHLVHDAMRCVPFAAIREIADLLDLSPAEVHDTMTFYEFFREQDRPLGKARVWVCRSLACGIRGGDELLQFGPRAELLDQDRDDFPDGRLLHQADEGLEPAEVQALAPLVVAGQGRGQSHVERRTEADARDQHPPSDIPQKLPTRARMAHHRRPFR